LENLNFTRQRGGKTYLASEVDLYIETLQNAYEEMQEELESTRNKMLEAATAGDSLQEPADVQDTGRNTEELEMKRQELLLEKQEFEEEKRAYTSRISDMQHSMEKLQKQSDDIKDERYRIKTRTEEIEKQSAELKKNQEAFRKEKEEFERQKLELMHEREDMERQCEDISKRQERLLAKEQELEESSAAADRIRPEYSGDGEHDSYRMISEDEETDDAPSGAQKYIDIFEEARKAADKYVSDIENRMNEMTDALNRDIEMRQDESRKRSLMIIRDARDGAEEILKEARGKAALIIQEAEEKIADTDAKCEERHHKCDEEINTSMERAQKEYARIRELIRQAGTEYADLTDKIHRSECDGVPSGDGQDENEKQNDSKSESEGADGQTQQE